MPDDLPKSEPLTPAGCLPPAIGIAIGWTVLGAFNGCTVGALPPFVWQTPTPILAGAVIGCGVALAYQALYPKPKTRPGTRWLYYGAAWMLSAGLCFFVTTALYNHHEFEPARAPIRFDRPDSVTLDFVASHSTTYDIIVDLERKLPFEDINAFTGDWQDPDKPKHKSPPRPEIVWNVVGPANSITEGWSGAYWGETVGLKIGGFDAIRGRTYRVTATVKKPSPSVQVLNPHLIVYLGVVRRTELNAFAIMIIFGGMIAGIIGLVLLIIAAGMKSRERRETG